MGNSQRKSDYGDIAIRTEQPFYFAGDLARGNIYLNICKTGYKGNIIEFTIVGKEKTEWDEGSGDEQRTYRGKNKFYSQSIPIYTFQNQIAEIGQYVFPFQFQLHPQIPGSFDYKGLHDSGYITYKVKAKFKSSEPNKPSIRNKQEFLVREPIKQEVIGQQQERMNNIYVCCCINKGTSRVKSFCDKNHYLQGDTAKLTLEIDNSNCNLNIEYFDIELLKELILRANANSHKYTQRILTQRIPGIQAGFKQIGSESRIIEIILMNQKRPQLVLTPTTNGKIVNQQYYLKISPKFQGCICCSAIPVIQFQIVMLYLIPPDYIQPLQQPSDWNPQTFDPVLIKFDQQHQMNITNNMQQNGPFMNKQ
ncbi:unnamed protein product (macronuclear) [Paramecium tetraurelia]|uniref:Uncharacterized protein n=1 Tax=Paramecium tetraurelia TaxID=5888 RepID=A0CGC0_PARTE|nr:uncharacterized protein GSPATT00007277001 [Paramecium tetraurelia]CAK69837.1 unnamed protein product [Paramecium tetraurelia]|eukprot:XP_001437234.1 hypothetical protein (macronuclear) [Paramecium tetraurelia strain d4-2]